MARFPLARHALAALAAALVSAPAALAAETLTFQRLDAQDGVAESIPVMFNPEEVTLNKSVEWEDQRREDRPARLPAPRTLSTSLEYDTEPSGQHVDDAMLPLLELAEVDPALDRPPTVRLIWGTGLRFTGFVRQLDVTYTRFNPDGVPVRAKVSVTLKERLDTAGAGLRR